MRRDRLAAQFAALLKWLLPACLSVCRVGRRGKGGAPRRPVSSGGWSQGPGSRAPRREASRGCAVNAKSQASAQRRAADGVLGRSPMKREQIIYSLIPVRVPGAGEWRGPGGGSSPPRPPPPAAPTYILPLDEFGALLEAVGHAHRLELQRVHSRLCPGHQGSSGLRATRARAAGTGRGARAPARLRGRSPPLRAGLLLAAPARCRGPAEAAWR